MKENMIIINLMEKGKIIYKEGNIYEGEFKNNLRHGEGILKYKN